MESAPKNTSPKDLGFRMPAEWEKQEAIWLTWPTDPTLWHGHFAELLPQYVAFVAEISHHEKVRLNCAMGELRDQAEKFLNGANADLKEIEFFDHPANDVWCRDHGPLFVKNDTTGEIALTDWIFNGWGGKFTANLDNEIPARIAEALGVKKFSYPFELEGGAIEVNGVGSLLTTECVQKNPNRANQGAGEAFENALKTALNIDKILWLPRGLENDDTDGHIDNLARFVAKETIVAAVEKDPSSRNYSALQENLERLKSMNFEVVELPLPEAITFDGVNLPASYANFLILNDAVIVPSYGQKRDGVARGILADVFPQRRIIGLDSRIILLEGGSFHCLSQQQPA